MFRNMFFENFFFFCVGLRIINEKVDSFIDISDKPTYIQDFSSFLYTLSK